MSTKELLRRAIREVFAEAKTIDSMTFGGSASAIPMSIMPTDAGRKVLTLARQGEFGPTLSAALADESNLTEVFRLMCVVLEIDPKRFKNLEVSAQGMLGPSQEDLLRKMERDRRLRTGDASLEDDPYESTPAARRYSKLDF